MKESVNRLYPNETVAANVLRYADSKSTGLPKPLTDYHAWICDTRENSGMTISPFQAKSLVWLARAIGARRVLEIGVFYGFSSLVWAHAVGPDGKVTGLEFNPEYAEKAREVFAAHGLSNIETIVGDGQKTLIELNPTEPYDVIFLDAEKTGYPSYLATILSKSQPGASNRLLRPGGIIVADNVLGSAMVADSSDANPAAVAMKDKPERQARFKANIPALDKFNTEMGANPRLEGLLMPLFDGLGLARLVD